MILKQGWFNPSFFDSVVEDTDWMAKFQEDKKYEIRAGNIGKYPEHDDKFTEIREQIKKLSNNLKQLN